MCYAMRIASHASHILFTFTPFVFFGFFCLIVRSCGAIATVSASTTTSQSIIVCAPETSNHSHSMQFTCESDENEKVFVCVCVCGVGLVFTLLYAAMHTTMVQSMWRTRDTQNKARKREREREVEGQHDDKDNYTLFMQKIISKSLLL